jgi:hypothetical protein
MKSQSGSSASFRRAAWQVACVLGLCSTLLACTGAADVPATPDLTTLQNEFDNPTAELDQTSVGETLMEMPSLRQLSTGFRAAGYTTEGVNRADGEASASAGSRLRVQGSINVTVRCPGELDVPAFGQNGTVNLVLGVQDNLIKRGIAMRANECVLRGDAIGTPIRVTIDGPIYMDLGRDLGLRQRWSGRLLMLVAGTIDVGGLVLENLAARWTDDRLEYLYRLPNDGGWVIAVITDQGMITIKDRKVTWGCSDGQACGELPL